MVARLLLIAVAAAGVAVAAPASKSWDNLARLSAGTPIEVNTIDRSERGQFVSSSTESLAMRTPAGEQKFQRAEVLRVVSRRQSRRLRNVLIGVGIGAAVGLVTDQTLGTYLRNESNPSGARAVIWAAPIALCGGIGAAIPSYP